MSKYLSNYKIIKELGYGMFATVYKIQIPNKKEKYALKIQHIKKEDMMPNTKSQIWREINFSTSFANKYPLQFVELLEYDFISNCELKQKYPFDTTEFSPHYQKLFKELNSSPYCVRKVYKLVDGDLYKLNGLLKIKQMYSMIIQLTYAIKLLHSNNYTHSDIHMGNIGWIRTSKNKFILISNLKIPTFGYIYKLIDYGMVINKSEISFANKKETKEFKNNFTNELVLLVHLMVDTKIYDYINENKISTDFNRDYDKFKESSYYDEINKYSDLKEIQLFLFDILYPTQFQKIAFGPDYSYTIPRKLFVPFDDIIYFILNYKNPDQIIKYFYNKLELV
jgi:serine/threonine protein kinase